MFFSDEEKRKREEEGLETLKKKRLLYLSAKAGKVYSEHAMDVYSGYATLYMLMALVPLLMLVVVTVNRIPSFSAEDFSDLLLEFVPEIEQVQSLLKDVILNLNSQSSGLLASLTAVIMFWSASSGITAVQKGMGQIYDNKRSALDARIVSLIFTLLFILMIPFLIIFQLMRKPLILFVSDILNKLNLFKAGSFFHSFMQYSYLLSFLFMVIIVVLTYIYLPSGKRSLKSQLPGALLSCGASTIFTYAFSFFMSTFWRASSFYGSLAAIFLTAVWLRSVMAILFYGAAFNKVLQEDNC